MLQLCHCQFLVCCASAPLSGTQHFPAMPDGRPVEGDMLVYHSWGTTSDLSGSLHPICLCLQELFEFLALHRQHPGFQGKGVVPARPGSRFLGQMGCVVQLIWQCPWLLYLEGDGGPAYLQQGAGKMSVAARPAGPRRGSWGEGRGAAKCPGPPTPLPCPALPSSPSLQARQGRAAQISCPRLARHQHLLSWQQGVTPAEPLFRVPICEPCAGFVRSLVRRVTPHPHPRSPCWEGDALH